MLGVTLSVVLVHLIVRVVVYAIGLFINIKLISVCWKKKETSTWQIHMTNSIFLTVYWPLDLTFLAVSKTIPNLSMYTGEWFCKFAAFVMIYGVYMIITNSLVVAAMKYVFIVHDQTARAYGHEKLQKIFSIIYLAIPFVFATMSLITNDYDSYKAVNVCLGLDREQMLRRSIWEKLFLCNSKKSSAIMTDNYSINVALQSTCAIKSVLSYITTFNLVEAFFYYKIFTKMKR